MSRRPRRTPADVAPVEPLTYAVVARVRDVVVAGGLLLVLSPALVAIALVIRATSPGPALFRQVRVGRGGRTFEMLKFRTMYVGVPEDAHRELVRRLLTVDGPEEEARVGTLEADARVTPVGRHLRRLSLDELPQLVNVLRNDMALVGPRPGLPYEVELYDDAARERLAVKPGVTGLWQVSGRKAVGMRAMFELDREYVRDRSVRGDLRILARTAGVLLRPGGAW